MAMYSDKKNMKINDNWIFYKEGQKAEIITLPHDAMLYETRDARCHNAENTGYFPGGKYVYEKVIRFSEEDITGKNIQLYFEGVYQKAKVYCNEVFIVSHEYGFTPFYADITDAVKEEDNHIKVIVDNSLEPNCRWYTGSGIYRSVHLFIRNKNYIDDVKVHTVSIDPPVIHIDAYPVENCDLTCRIYGEDIDFTIPLKLIYGTHYAGEAELSNVKLWYPDSPNLYNCTVKSTTDSMDVRFGIRTIKCSAESGFLINNQRVLLRGGCIHSDHGILGACSYRDAEFRKVKILKEAGYNAIRCAHNPACNDFLDACDELGMLVMDEAFDGWYIPKTYHDYSRVFHDNWRDDIKAMVRTGYNHPSVVIQSIGNEVTETVDDKGILLAKEMAEYLKQLDGTRPVTAAINVLLNVYTRMGFGVYKETKEYTAEKLPPKKEGYVEKKTGSAFFNATVQKLGPLMFFMSKGRRGDNAIKKVAEYLDILGLNYAASRYDEDTAKYPDRVMVGAETIIRELPYNWERVKKYPSVIGDFAWAAWDYLGEAGIGDYMYHSYSGLPLLAGSGTIDILGNIGAEAVFQQIVWGLRKKPYICVSPLNHSGEIPKKSAWRFTNGINSWNWPGYIGKKTQVEVYSDADRVRLYLDERLIDEKKVKKYIALFNIRYVPGVLRAIAVYDDHEEETSLASGSGKMSLQSQVIYEGEELIFIEIIAKDEKNLHLPVAENHIRIQCEGDVDLVGLGSARTKTDESYLSKETHLYQGRALAILRKKDTYKKLPVVNVEWE